MLVHDGWKSPGLWYTDPILHHCIPLSLSHILNICKTIQFIRISAYQHKCMKICSLLTCEAKAGFYNTLGTLIRFTMVFVSHCCEKQVSCHLLLFSKVYKSNLLYICTALIFVLQWHIHTEKTTKCCIYSVLLLLFPS